jgi:5'(3')-deoxyribonucleotidase
VKRVLIDCDGVLADLCGAVCALLGNGRRPEDFERHDFFHTLTPAELARVNAHYEQPGTIEAIPWYPAAKAFAFALRNSGADLVCVTAPWHSPTWLAERRAWLRDYVHANDVIGCPSKRKRHVSGDVLIEDRADTLEDWCTDHPRGRGVLIDRPWNRGATLHPRVTRARTYFEAMRAVSL